MVEYSCLHHDGQKEERERENVMARKREKEDSLLLPLLPLLFHAGSQPMGCDTHIQGGSSLLTQSCLMPSQTHPKLCFPNLGSTHPNQVDNQD
jgi:hypothetical protein